MTPAASPEEEAALTRHLEDMMAFYGRGCAIVLNALHLLFWPTDRFLLPADPVVQRTMFWFRAGTFCCHALFLLLLRFRALRRHTFLLLILTICASSAVFGWAMAQLGDLSAPYFYLTYLAPLGLGAVPERPRRRIFLSPLCGAVLCLAYFLCRPQEISSPRFGTALAAMAFVIAVSVSIGQGIYLLSRREFLTSRALAAAEERARLAQELHDEVGQQLTGLRYLAAGLRNRSQEETTRAGLSSLQEELGRLHDALRTLVTDPQPRALEEQGLVPALRQLVARTRAHTGLSLSLAEEVAPGVSPSRQQAAAAYRIVQESLTNAVRHARARTIRVRISLTAQTLAATVTDDGVGIDPAERPRTTMGLSGMRERAAALGGALTVDRRPGGGTVVRLQLPRAAEK